MQTLRFHPLRVGAPSGQRVFRAQNHSETTQHLRHNEARAVRQDVNFPSLSGLTAAVAGVSTLFHASPALADVFDPSAISAAQAAGSAGVVLVTASAAAYGSILLMQAMFRGVKLPYLSQHREQQQASGYGRFESATSQKGGNTPAFALGVPSGPSSPTTFSFQPSSAPSKNPKPSSASTTVPKQPKPAPFVAPANDTTESHTSQSQGSIAVATPGEAIETITDGSVPPSAAVPASGSPAKRSPASAAIGSRSLQAVFQTGPGRSGYSTAAVEAIPAQLENALEPALVAIAPGGPEPQLDTMFPEAEAASALSMSKAAAAEPVDVLSEFSTAAEAAGELLDSAEASSMTAEQQQVEYSARLRAVRMEANKKAAEEARRQQLRQRALDNLQPPPPEPEQHPVPGAVMQQAGTTHGPLHGLAAFFASLVAWMQALWQRLVQTLSARFRGSSSRPAWS